MIQSGDPSGTGEGGQSIYEDVEFERYDEEWARLCGKEVGEKVVFGDEVHSRLKFNRRGLVGLAKDSVGGYGSQWFVTLGDCRSELDGKMTMFGRVEGEGIYNVVKIAEGERVGDGERPVYPEKVLGVEVLEMPRGKAWEGMRARVRRVQEVVRSVEEGAKKKVGKKKGKVMLSFGGGEEEGEDMGVAVRPKKAKFNTAIIDGPVGAEPVKANGGAKKAKPAPAKRKASPSLDSTVPAKRKVSSPSPSSPRHYRKQSHSSPQAQLPIRNEETPSDSPSPTPPRLTSQPKTSDLESQISALKQSMRRPNTTATSIEKPKSALEELIPATSTRARKRPRPGDSLNDKENERKSVAMLEKFRRRLIAADQSESAKKPEPASQVNGDGNKESNGKLHEGLVNGDEEPSTALVVVADDDEEAQLCDLHFIINCQSCSRWDDQDDAKEAEDDNDRGFLGHRLAFGKDRLGKDWDWKKKDRNRLVDDDGGLVVIDPREKEKDLKRGKKGRKW